MFTKTVSTVKSYVNPVTRNCLQPHPVMINVTGTRFVPRTTREIYKLLVHRVFDQPVSLQFWSKKFPNFDVERIFQTVHVSYYPCDCVELNFKVGHNCIFTRDKLYRYKISDTDLCPVCLLSIEDICIIFRMSKVKTFS